MTRTLSRAAVAVLAGALASQFAHADLIVNDPFLTGTDPSAGQYVVGPAPRLNTQGPSVQGYSAGSLWNGGTQTSQPQVVAGSLDVLGASYETGGKIQYDGAPVDNNYRSAARNFATPYASASANGPVVLSGMISTGAFPDIPADAGLRGYALFGFTNTVWAFGSNSVGTLAGYYLGFHAKPDDTFDLIIRHRQGTTTGSTAVQEDIVVLPNASPSTTYQFLIKTDVNVVGGNQEIVHYWINPTDVSSEATATSTALASGSFQDFSLQNATQDITRTTVATLNWDATVYFDEFRMGTTFADVAGQPVIGAPGDANVDGVVNADDFALIDRGFAKHLIGWTNGDFNRDGVVDQNDYLLIDTAYAQQNGGQPSPALLAQRQTEFGDAYVSSLLTAVPEPTSLAACGLAALSLLSRRRRLA